MDYTPKQQETHKTKKILAKQQRAMLQKFMQRSVDTDGNDRQWIQITKLTIPEVQSSRQRKCPDMPSATHEQDAFCLNSDENDSEVRDHSPYMRSTHYQTQDMDIKHQKQLKRLERLTAAKIQLRSKETNQTLQTNKEAEEGKHSRNQGEAKESLTRLKLGDLMKKAQVRQKSSVEFSDADNYRHSGGIRVTPTLHQSLDMSIQEHALAGPKIAQNSQIEKKPEIQQYDPVSARFHNNSINESPRQVSKISSLKKFLKPEEIPPDPFVGLKFDLPSPYRKIINQSDMTFMSKYATPNQSVQKDLQMNLPLQFSYDFGQNEFKQRVPSHDNCVLRIKKVNKANGIYTQQNADLTSDCVENVVSQHKKAILRGNSHLYRFQEKIKTKQVSISQASPSFPNLKPKNGFPQRPFAARDNDFISTHNQRQKRRNVRIISNQADRKERELQLWYKSTANPANRVKSMIDISINKQMSPFSKLQSHGARSQREALSNVSQYVRFLSPDETIDKYKYFPQARSPDLNYKVSRMADYL